MSSVTLKEIAGKAGVHISTVSRILNSPDGSFARKEVQDRVWAAVKESGYVPNQSARALRQASPKARAQEAESLTCILGRTRRMEDNPFFEQVARAIEQHALQMGYTVGFSYSVIDPDHKALLTGGDKGGKGSAIVLGRLDNVRIIRFLEQNYRNLVYIGRSPIQTDWDQVICDGYEASQIAVEHLIGFGHKQIGYIGETGSETRYHAYLETMERNGLEPLPCHIASCDQNSAEGGYAGADALLKNASPMPTAVFCAADISAIAAMRRFKEAKILIPTELSMVSMDNITLSAYVSPMLTTVGMPIVELGNIAVQTLIDRASRRHKIPMKIILPNKLVRRESVAAPRGYVEDYTI